MILRNSTKKNIQIVQIDHKTWIEIPEGKDPEKARIKFIKKQEEAEKERIRFGNRGLSVIKN